MQGQEIGLMYGSAPRRQHSSWHVVNTDRLSPRGLKRAGMNVTRLGCTVAMQEAPSWGWWRSWQRAGPGSPGQESPGLRVWGGKRSLADTEPAGQGSGPGPARPSFLVNNSQKLLLQNTAEQRGLHRPWGALETSVRDVFLVREAQQLVGAGEEGKVGEEGGRERRKKGGGRGKRGQKEKEEKEGGWEDGEKGGGARGRVLPQL